MLRRNECRFNFKNRPVITGDLKGGPKQPPLPLIGVARSLPLIGLTWSDLIWLDLNWLTLSDLTRLDFDLTWPDLTLAWPSLNWPALAHQTWPKPNKVDPTRPALTWVFLTSDLVIELTHGWCLPEHGHLCTQNCLPMHHDLTDPEQIILPDAHTMQHSASAENPGSRTFSVNAIRMSSALTSRLFNIWHRGAIWRYLSGFWCRRTVIFGWELQHRPRWLDVRARQRHRMAGLPTVQREGYSGTWWPQRIA